MFIQAHAGRRPTSDRLVREEVGLLLGNPVTLHQLAPDGGSGLIILLCGKGNDSDHGQATVVQLSGLEGEDLFLRFSGEEVQGIEAEITREVVILDLAGTTGVSPSDGDTVGLADSDGGQDELPESGEDLFNTLELDKGVNTVEGGEDWAPLLSNDPTEGSKHGDTAVGELGFAESLGFINGEGGRRSESERVPEVDTGLTGGGRDTRESQHVFFAGRGALDGL